MHASSLYEFNSVCSTHLLQTEFSEFKHFLQNKNSLIICDKQVYNLYKELFHNHPDSALFLLSSGERTKSQTTVNRLHNWLFTRKAHRSSTIVIIGGGTISDVSVYAISIFKRGCRVVLIPTTLLAMVDASIGGKTAINYLGSKNLLGTFYPATEVLICPEFLSSLPHKEVLNGLAEMLKLWFINPELELPIPNVEQLMASSHIYDYASAKLQICVNDLFDTGTRRHLNLGHTFAHAIEAYSAYRIPHGEAVVAGMAMAALCSYNLSLIDQTIYNRILALIKDFVFSENPLTQMESDFIEHLPSYIIQDKKITCGRLTLILYSGLREVIIYDQLTTKDLIKLLRHQS